MAFCPVFFQAAGHFAAAGKRTGRKPGNGLCFVDKTSCLIDYCNKSDFGKSRLVHLLIKGLAEEGFINKSQLNKPQTKLRAAQYSINMAFL